MPLGCELRSRVESFAANIILQEGRLPVRGFLGPEAPLCVDYDVPFIPHHDCRVGTVDADGWTRDGTVAVVIYPPAEIQYILPSKAV